MKIPDTFIVGAPRCGTTALFEYLGQHPDFYCSTLKEPHFFGADTHYPKRPTLDQYLSYFAGARGEKRISEASTSYLFSTCAAQQIRDFSPSARIIAMVRNPIETMYSLHRMVLYYCDEDIEDFEAALASEEDRKRGLRWPAKPHIINYLLYRDVVSYTEQIKRYFDVFGRDRVHVIVHDDFRASPADAYRETLRFLDLDADFRADLRPVNQNRDARSRRLQAILLNGRLARVRQGLLPRRADEIVFGTLRRLNTSSKPRQAMNPKLKRNLQAEFTPEVERLSTLLGRDLTHWCKPHESEMTAVDRH